MYYGLKQGQITSNIEKKYVFKLIHLIALCSKITHTVLFLKRILHHFSAFCCFLQSSNVRMSEGTFCRVVVHISVFTKKISHPTHGLGWFGNVCPRLC